MNKKVVIGIITIIILGGIFSIIEKEKSQDHTQVNNDKDLGIPINTTKISMEKLDNKIIYMGDLVPKEISKVSSKAQGHIEKIYVDNGDMVKKKQILMKLENKDIKLKIEKLNIQLKEAQLNHEYFLKELKKTHELFIAEAISKTQYEKIEHEANMAELKVEEVKSSLKELKSNLEDTVIRAPIDGRITGLDNVVGDMAQRGSPILMIDNIKELYVEVQMPESDIMKLKKSKKVYLNFPKIDKEMESMISKLPENISTKTRVGVVEIGPIKLKNYEDIILGSTIKTYFIIEEYSEALAVEKDAIKTIGNKNVVYLIKDNKARKKEIKLGFSQKNKVQINGDIKKGEIVANSNLDLLYDGAKIFIFEGID